MRKYLIVILNKFRSIYIKIGITLILVSSFYFLFFNLHTNKDEEINFINKNYTLVETTTSDLNTFANQDNYDFHIENSKEYLIIYFFNNEKEKIELFKVGLEIKPMSHYKYINKHWYINNKDKELGTKEHAIGEINEIVNLVDIVLKMNQ